MTPSAANCCCGWLLRRLHNAALEVCCTCQHALHGSICPVPLAADCQSATQDQVVPCLTFTEEAEDELWLLVLLLAAAFGARL